MILPEVDKIIFELSDDATKILLTKAYPNYFNLADRFYFTKDPDNLLTGLIAKNGDLKLLNWAKNQKYRLTKEINDYAAENGDLEMLIWAKSNNIGYSWGIFNRGINHLEVLRWLKNNTQCEILSDSVQLAANNNQLEVLKWLKGYVGLDNPVLLGAAARNNNIKMINLVTRFTPSNINFCAEAALNNHLDMIIWGLNDGYKLNSAVCANAALNGHLDLLIWLRTNNCPWDKHTCSNAATNNHLTVLIWAINNGCDYDQSVYLNSHLRIIMWLKDNTKLELNSEIIANFAASQGHLYILQWLKENNYQYKFDIFRLAASHGHLNILIWAKNNGLTCKSVSQCNIIGRKYRSICNFIVNQGCNCNYCYQYSDEVTEFIELIDDLWCEYYDWDWEYELEEALETIEFVELYKWYNYVYYDDEYRWEYLQAEALDILEFVENYYYWEYHYDYK